ncbi:TonB-dependent receptor [Lysobacter sp. MMG2]|uniref:TonB-dependent receptor n=1 Tax=Lysobacter sp. MMG2 TaxID=2801338 RepID=UPI001C21DBCC|nr:TonB-dependent receptor [Lysobacter sp. MMG2]MBU8976067.1 TonB-dependent receptor [Lysobacter sp. MMG2]
MLHVDAISKQRGATRVMSGPMRRSPLAVVVAATLAMAVAAPALAQQAATDLDKVVVTANKRSENIREVPSSISVITAEAIENQHATQLSDFQATVPGLYISSNGSPGQTQVSLRGVSPLSSSATVGTYLDETPLGSSGIYQAANFFALDLLPYDINRIEVLRGPQGTLYGASAMGGLVKYVSTPPDTENREFRIGGGLSSVKDSDDLGWNARFGANLPLADNRLGLRISYARNDLPGYIDNVVNGEEDINSGEQTSARAALRWQGESATLDLTAMRQTIDSDNNGQVALDPEGQRPLFGDLKNSIFVDEPFYKDVDYYSATVNWNLGWADFVSATGYSESRSVQRQDATVQYGGVADLLLGLPEPGSSYFDIGLDLDKFTQEFRLVSKENGPFEWMAGVFYTKEDAFQSQTVKLNQLDGSPLPAPFDEIAGTLAVLEIPSTYEETAFFANGAYRFTDAFKISAGVRWARNEQDFSQNVTEGILIPLGNTPNSSSEDVFTWSLSPQLQLSEEAMVYARVATGYQPGGPNVLVEGLPSQVDSSTLTNYELGLKSLWADNRLQFDLTGFHIAWDDIQVASVVNGISGLVNAGEASSTGVEVALLFHATDHFDLGLNGAYTDAKLDEDYPLIAVPSPPYEVQITSGAKGDVLPYVPEWSWNATADYYWTLSGGWTARIGAALRYVGERRAGTTSRQDVVVAATGAVLQSEVTPPLELGHYTAFDLNASVANDHWTFRAYVKNASDERGYQTMGDVTSELTDVTAKLNAAPIQPRTIGVEVDYRF